MYDDTFLETELADRITSEELEQIKKQINYSDNEEVENYE